MLFSSNKIRKLDNLMVIQFFQNKKLFYYMSNPNYTRVGKISSAIIIFSLVGYFFISGKGIFDNSTKLYVFSQEASGLKRESPVIFRGLKIGKISGLYLEQGKFLVELSIDEEMKLSTSAEFYTFLAGPLGSRKIEVKITEEGNYFYKNGDTISTSLIYKPMTNLVDSSFLKVIEPSIKELSKTVGQVLIDYAESIDTINIEIKGKQQGIKN